jgi:hypothetical protein
LLHVHNSAAACRCSLTRESHIARKRYKNLSGNSGITEYEVGPEFIWIWFSGEAYRYDYSKPGKQDVDVMKQLAEAGRGLATYINQHVQKNYADKL